MANTLVEISDDLGIVSSLLEAAWLAAGSLHDEEQGPMQELLVITRAKLTAAHDKLEEYLRLPIDTGGEDLADV